MLERPPTTHVDHHRVVRIVASNRCLNAPAWKVAVPGSQDWSVLTRRPDRNTVTRHGDRRSSRPDSPQEIERRRDRALSRAIAATGLGLLEGEDRSASTRR